MSSLVEEKKQDSQGALEKVDTNIVSMETNNILNLTLVDKYIEIFEERKEEFGNKNIIGPERMIKAERDY